MLFLEMGLNVRGFCVIVSLQWSMLVAGNSLIPMNRKHCVVAQCHVESLESEGPLKLNVSFTSGGAHEMLEGKDYYNIDVKLSYIC